MPQSNYTQANYTQVDFVPHRFPQARELNEAQQLLDQRLTGVANVFLTDGGLVSGGGIRVDSQTGEVLVEAGQVYIQGQVFALEAAQFVIPVTGEVPVGVILVTDIVTYEDDPSLRGQAPGTRAFGEPGANRIRKQASWGWDGNVTLGDFFAVYQVNNGVVLDQSPPPELDGINSALARYDREANGSYVVEGMTVVPLGPDDEGRQVFTITGGTANVWGWKITREVDLRHSELEAPDLSYVSAEPHTYTGGPLVLNHGPINHVSEITVLKERTVDVTHGAYSGAVDPLPETSVSVIVSVEQDGVTYQEGNDFARVGDSVDWSPAGAEPAPGSTYSVTFRFFDNVDPTSLDPITQTLSIAEAVTNSTVLVDYSWKLPRIDALALDRNGRVSYIKGRSSAFNPWPPSIPGDLLKLAEITNRWSQIPLVALSRTRSVHYDELLTYADMIDDLFQLVSLERLRRDVDAKEVAAKRGVFVDPFLDDDMRDQGLAQSGAIVLRRLMLPIGVEALSLEQGDDLLSLPYAEEDIIAQPLVSGAMKINPYMAFEPLPGTLRLSPPRDFWSQRQTRWASPVTRIIRGEFSGTNATTQLVSRTTTSLPFIRVRDVAFTVRGFGAGEILETLSFDGINVETFA